MSNTHSPHCRGSGHIHRKEPCENYLRMSSSVSLLNTTECKWRRQNDSEYEPKKLTWKVNNNKHSPKIGISKPLWVARASHPLFPISLDWLLPLAYRDAESGEISESSAREVQARKESSKATVARSRQLSPLPVHGLQCNQVYSRSCPKADIFHFPISPNLAKCQEISTKEWATWQKSLSFNFYFHGRQRTGKSKTLI